MASPKDVLKQIADNEVKFVDFRFTDTVGREHHVSVPTSAIDEDKLESGQAFDGSSIAGWKGIEASDMLLIPDLSTANMDPFREEPTLILSCDVVEPSDLKGYDRDPRSLAKRAEAYLKSRPGRYRLLRSGTRILRVRRRDLEHRHVGHLRQDQVGRGLLVHRPGLRRRQHRPSSLGQGRLLPVPRSIRSRTCVRKCAC